MALEVLFHEAPEGNDKTLASSLRIASPKPLGAWTGTRDQDAQCWSFKELKNSQGTGLGRAGKEQCSHSTEKGLLRGKEMVGKEYR